MWLIRVGPFLRCLEPSLCCKLNANKSQFVYATNEIKISKIGKDRFDGTWRSCIMHGMLNLVHCNRHDQGKRYYSPHRKIARVPQRYQVYNRSKLEQQFSCVQFKVSTSFFSFFLFFFSFGNYYLLSYLRYFLGFFISSAEIYRFFFFFWNLQLDDVGSAKGMAGKERELDEFPYSTSTLINQSTTASWHF